MSTQLYLAEDKPFIMEFDSDIPETEYSREAGWGIDPMAALIAKQELERDELMVYLAEHTH